MTQSELITLLEELRSTLVSVSTGGPRIDQVNAHYGEVYRAVEDELSRRGIPNPLPFADLWQWYGRWSGGDLPSYASRRTFIADLFQPLVAQIRAGSQVRAEPTGWTRVDRALGEARDRIAAATSEEQFQAVGLLCRETQISLAQAVFDPARHTILDPPRGSLSPADAKRMLEAYIAVELRGGAEDETRAHAKSALALASNLVHKRTATFRHAAICVEATGAVVNIIAIVSGHRDPQH